MAVVLVAGWAVDSVAAREVGLVQEVARVLAQAAEVASALELAEALEVGLGSAAEPAVVAVGTRAAGTITAGAASRRADISTDELLFSFLLHSVLHDLI